MGEAVVANRVKKAGHKKIACQRGGWGGGGYEDIAIRQIL